MATFLLLHGACHGGWCWDAVGDLLRASGHSVLAPDLPCDDVSAGLDEYAAVAVSALAGDLGGRSSTADVVVVGHSLGALTVPIVATRWPVRRMVMLAGIVGAPGRSLAQLATEDADRDLPLAPEDLETDAEHRFCFSPSGARRVLFHDCPPAAAEAAIARLRFQRSMWTQVAPFTAWPDVEVVSITCAGDRVVNPEWSDRVARERLGVEPVHLPGGHSPFLARPRELADVLLTGL
jgi:pimeloyl-ACP methyl ester carboxylesterase